MKKVLFALAIIFTMSLSVTSCKKENKEELKNEKTSQVYQCPMDCEKGKSYTKPGNCPVCKMELKAKKPGEKTQAIQKAEKHEH